MSELKITCPSCSTEIKVTESLAAPLIQATRQEYEAKIALKEGDISRREAALKAELEAIAAAKQSIDEQVCGEAENGAFRDSSGRGQKGQVGRGIELDTKDERARGNSRLARAARRQAQRSPEGAG